MSAVTAEVQVLTAEVRVLMVGSRQVTLSVFRQLDRVSREDCDPFGRVRDKEGTGIEVIGRTSDGVLVRSRTSKPQHIVKYYVPDEFVKSLNPAAVWRTGSCRYIKLADGLDMELAGFHVRQSYPEIHDVEDLFGTINEETACFKDDMDYWSRWSALPLIVLAGLK